MTQDMTKIYLQPETDIINIELQEMIAISGGGIANGDAVGQEYTNTDITYSKSFDFLIEEPEQTSKEDFDDEEFFEEEEI